MPGFPDIENALLDWLKSTFPELADDTMVDEHVGTVTPGLALDRRLPFVQVQKLTGRDDYFKDYPVVDIDVFGDRRDVAYALAEAIRSAILETPFTAGTVRVRTSETRTSPGLRPWENTRLARFGATYELSVLGR